MLRRNRCPACLQCYIYIQREREGSGVRMLAYAAEQGLTTMRRRTSSPPVAALLRLAAAIVLCGGGCCKADQGASYCVDGDRRALLDVLRGLSGDDDSHHHQQRGWSDGDCCRWAGVTCSSSPAGRVTGLDLTRLTGFGYGTVRLLNATPFLPLTELRSLNLSSLGVYRCFPGFEVWSDLHKLEIIDLSGNYLNDSSIPSLAALSSLRSLIMDGNLLSSALSIKQLSAIKQLHTLDLGHNSIKGTLSADICNMENLQELHLSSNKLFGELPSCIGTLISLKILDLSNNQLTVNFPSVSFANFTSLVKLSLSNNNLKGVLLLNSLSNNSQLTHLELSSTSSHFHVRTENPATNLSAQLQVLELRNCNLNEDSAMTPSFLLHQHSLDFIDMANNNLSGHFPSWLIENNMNLLILNLQGNSFSGPLFLPPIVHNNMVWLDVSCNNISKLPMDINTTVPNMQYLNLSWNSLRGGFPSALSYMENLVYLDLSYNEISDNIGAAFVGGISALFLSGNSFYGSFPQDILFSSIYHLALNDNKITGKIPDNICYSQLTMIDISNNELNGSLPACIDALSTLTFLNLRDNSLTGSVPLELCHLKFLVFLDLSKNYFSGPMDCLPNPYYLHLSENQLTGTFPLPLSLGIEIVTIDLRGNQFGGTIPTLIDEAFLGLRILSLEGNMFEGIIPDDICNLNNLRLLDLSHNNLSGELPSCMSDMGLSGGTYDFEFMDTHHSLSSIPDIDFSFKPDQEEFLTKRRQDYYKGSILRYMSGLDFSSNQLKGSIPESIGDMTWLRALNLSNNYLDGSIPKSLSDLSDLESLDFSHNNLSGQIPAELAALQSLEVFSVAHNNLSGPTPGTSGQFITFDLSSYEGNPCLCGPPLPRSCGGARPDDGEHEEDDDRFGDTMLLFGSSALFYVIGFWTSLIVLYFNASWRWSWFSSVDRFGDFLMVLIGYK